VPRPDRSPWPGSWPGHPPILPIPGTSSVTHLETNVAATSLELAPDEVAAITARRASDS
jgi:aryl-alcohol dehydrogenase-like predicted oxidoreductase